MGNCTYGESAVKVIPALLVCAALALASDAKMTETERAKTLKLLAETESEFLNSVDGLTDAQWNYRASPEKWSIAQTAEHIMLSESLVFSAVGGTMQAPVDSDWEAKTGSKAALLEAALPDRGQKATAPEPLQPTSKLTHEEIVTRYKEARAKTIAFTKSTDLALKEHISKHPFFGPINAYDWLIRVPLHNDRHNLQIAEVKMSPGFPKMSSNRELLWQ
jgi:hypothetical protein